MNFLTIFSLLFLVTTVKSQQNQVCLTMSMQVEGQSHALGQGPPGRRGPLGPPGPKGDSGFPGQCVCDPSEINKLQEEMRNIRDSINVLMSRSHTHTDKGFAHGGMEPYRGRLDNTQRSDQHGAWAAAHPLKVGDWTQVDFKTPTFITGIVTQGRPQAGPQWVTSYKISYGNSTKQMRVIQENGSDLIFQGNRDRDTKVVNMFPHPLSARYFRLLAQTWNTHITIRLDYLTC
ncbi:lactadherin-like isoform X3 [Clavelina lepadiformis]|uniref:lactadherin-like isoform X3 n=1 Tax=Clavelina lepadiformis TaxID=159417 RepID=UPI004041F703